MTTVGFSPDDAKRIARTVKTSERAAGKYDHIRGRHNPTENLVWAEITAVGDSTTADAGHYEWTALEPDSTGGFTTNADWGQGTFASGYAVSVKGTPNVAVGSHVLLRPSMKEDFYVFAETSTIQYAEAKASVGYAGASTCYMLDWDGTAYQRGDEITVYNTYFPGVMFGADEDSTQDFGDKFPIYWEENEERWEALGAGHTFLVGVAEENIAAGGSCSDCVSVSLDASDMRDIKVDVFFAYGDINSGDTIALWFDNPGENPGGHWDAAKPYIDPGCGLKIEDSTDSTDQGKLVVDSAALFGCGFRESDATDDCAVEFDASAVAGSGLSGSGCTLSLDITDGCGITSAGGTIAVNNSDLAGAGLVAGSGCSLDLSLAGGCGILYTGGSISVVASDLAGDGLTTGAGCQLDIDPGCHFDTSGGTMNLDVSSLVAPPLMVSSQPCDAITIDIGCGMEIDGTQLGVRRDMLQGLTLMNSSETPCALDVDVEAIAGDGLIGDNAGLELSIDCAWIAANCDLTAIEADLTAGCGIDITSNVVSVNTTDLAGDGLGETGDCDLTVVPGCGITVNATGVSIDADDLIGTGIKRAVGGCALEADMTAIASAIGAGCGLDTSVPGQLSVDHSALAGTYLDPGINCQLDVDANTLTSAIAGCGLNAAGGSMSVDNSALAGNHLDPGVNCQIDIDVAGLAAALAGVGLNSTGGVLNVDQSCCDNTATFWAMDDNPAYTAGDVDVDVDGSALVFGYFDAKGRRRKLTMVGEIDHEWEQPT